MAPTRERGSSSGDGDATPRTPRLGITGYWNLMRDGYDEVCCDLPPPPALSLPLKTETLAPADHTLPVRWAAQLVKAIIRPPRAEYTIAELGPARFEYGGHTFIREDSTFTNPRKMTLQCSFWRRESLSEPTPCVVYTHGNASCRAEALQIIAPVLATGASVVSFDFAGCGLSEGEYISLGWHEKDDLAAALEHIRGTGLVSAILLWGRSMGASSAVLQASRDPSLAGLILDSPFASLEQVALELVTTAPETVQGAPKIPSWLVKTALHVVAGSVKSKAHFDLYKLRPVDAAKTCFVPAVFGTASKDILVRPHHSQQIYDMYAGDKNVVRFDGDHNDVRPGFFLDSACIFLKQALLLPESAQLDVPLDRDGRPLALGQALRMQARSGLGALGSVPFHRPNQHVETPHRSELEDFEEELLRQAIAASLEASGEAQPGGGGVQVAQPLEGPSPTMVDLSDSTAASVPSGDVTAGVLAAIAAAGGAGGAGGGGGVHELPAVGGGGDDDVDDVLLQQAIRLSLEAAEKDAKAASAPAAPAPAAPPARPPLAQPAPTPAQQGDDPASVQSQRPPVPPSHDPELAD
jgi:hypothetical protein